MNLIIHRGSKEIGGSCVEIRCHKARIIVDFGIPLVASSGERFDAKTLERKTLSELKGQKILPRITGLYKNELKQIDAVLISHSHLDHYGFLKYLHQDIPVYMSGGARELIEITKIFTPFKIGYLNVRTIRNKQPLQINGIEVTPYLVDHSAFDAFAFLIEAEGRKVFYSGDFRAHGRKSVLFDRFLKNHPRKIDYLLMEGSMLGRDEQIFQDEKAVEEGLVSILQERKNITFFAASSQNIDRIVSAYRACLRTKSTFVIDLYTAFILHKLRKISKRIPQYDWNNIRIKYFKSHADSLANGGHKELLYRFNEKKIELDEIDENKNHMLMLMRDNSLFPIVLKKLRNIGGSVFVWSMWEGYLTDRFKKDCHEMGIHLKTIHTSGHAAVKDLRRLLGALRPKTLIPIHTFEPENYRDLYRSVRILQDGESLEIN